MLVMITLKSSDLASIGQKVAPRDGGGSMVRVEDKLQKMMRRFDLEQMPAYDKFMKDMVTKMRSVSFEDDEKIQHCSAIPTSSLV